MISSIMFAQSQMKDPAARAARQSEKMKSVLSLNEAQYASIRDINEKYADKYSALKREEIAKKNKHAEFSTLRKDHQKEIETVLTSEQKTKWENYKAE